MPGPSDLGHLHAHGLEHADRDVEESPGDRRRLRQPGAARSGRGRQELLRQSGRGSGMVELIASLLALEHGRLFRTLNYETPDPECAIYVVAAEDVSPGNSFINLSVTPQGQASAVMIRRG